MSNLFKAITIVWVAYFFSVIALIKVGAAEAERVVYDLELPALTTTNRNWGVEWTEEDKYCLALNIYFEARGEPVRGMYAVADVVMYRAEHADYPDTICGVIKDGAAFSWYMDEYSNDPIDGRSFEEALFIANDILTDPTYPGMIDYALFYHAEYVQPKWAEGFELVTKIGEHVFYRP